MKWIYRYLDDWQVALAAVMLLACVVMGVVVAGLAAAKQLGLVK